MSIFIEKDGKKTLPSSFYIKILIFLCIICVSIILLQPVQHAINLVMLNIRANFLEGIERQIGMDIRYSSIRPSFFGSFDIRNLKLIKNDSVFLSVNRVRFYFSMSELFFKKKFAVNKIQIDQPILRVKYERDKDTFELLSSMLNNSEGDLQLTEFMPQEADYKINNFSLFFSGEDTAFNVQRMDVDISKDGERIIIGGKFDCEAGYSGFLDTIFLVKTTVSINCAYNSAGQYSQDLRSGNANISFLTLSFLEQAVNKREASFLLPSSNGSAKSIFSLKPVSAAVSFDENSLHITPSQQASLSYDINCDLKTGAIDARVDFDRFILSDYADFSDYWKKFNHIFNVTVTGSSSLNYDENKIVKYAVDLLGGEFFTTEGSGTETITDSFVIDAYGDLDQIVLNDFRLGVSADTAKAGLFQGILNYQGSIGFDPVLPSGMFSVSRFSLNGIDDIGAAFTISSNTREINIRGDSVNVGRASFSNPDIRLYPQKSYVGITAAIDCENNGTVYFDAVLNKNPLELEAALSLASFSVVDLIEVIRPFMDFFNIPSSGAAFFNDISLDTEFFFTTDFKNIVYNAPYTVINFPDSEGFLSLSGTDRQITLSECVLNIYENDFLIYAQFDYSNPQDLVFQLEASYLDMAWHIEGQILDSQQLIIQDPNGLNIYGFISNTGSRSGYIECMDFPVPVKGRQSYLNLYITLRYDSPDFWYLDVAHLEVQDLLYGTDYFRISGVADQDGASFREILYSDSIGLLAGSADFSWDNDFSYLQLLINMTDGREDGEYYFVEGVYKNGHIDINASVSEMHLERFVSTNAAILISADAILLWDSINSFDANVNLSSLYARIQEGIITASGGVSLTNDELLVRDFNFEYINVKSTINLLQLNRARGIAKTNINIWGHLEKWLEGEVDFTANFAQIDTWLDIRQALSSIDGTLKIENIQYGDMMKDEFIFDFSNDNGKVSFSGGERNMIRFDMDSNGNFFAGLSAPVPIQGTIAGVYKNGLIDAHCGSFFIDLSALWKLASNIDDFNIDGGYITGKLDIRGPLFNPEFFGEGRGSSLRLQAPTFITEDIRPAPFNAIAQGYEITFGPTMVISGNGMGNVTGWMLFEYWKPKSISLNIDVPRQNPVPYNVNIEGFLANGNASGKLDLAIDTGNSIIEISGNLYTNETEMGLNMDDLMAQSEFGQYPELEFNSIVNLSVTAGPMVEFIWPNGNNPILRANPEMGTVFIVSADTQAGQFTMNSDIKIRSGEVYYFERSFYIREGSMVFRENEREFSPMLSARAEIRDRSESGPVTITMVIENEPLFSFEPRFETTPSLSQLEIYTILGQNLNSIQGNDNTDVAQRFLLASTADLVTQFVASSDIFSQFVFFRQIERQIRNFFGLDMFNVRTRLVQNAVVSGVTGLGQEPVDRNSRVGNYFDNTTVFIGKYFGQDMFGQAMLTMKYDENSTDIGGMKFELDIGIELQSPFFNIRWDFFPYHPENLWVNDNSITLSWSKSF